MNLAVGKEVIDRQMSSMCSLHMTRRRKLIVSLEPSVHRLQCSACQVSGLLWLCLERGAQLHVEEAKEGGRLGGRAQQAAASTPYPHPRLRLRGAEFPGKTSLEKGRAGVGAGSSCWRSHGMRGLSGEENVITET